MEDKKPKSYFDVVGPRKTTPPRNPQFRNKATLNSKLNDPTHNMPVETSRSTGYSGDQPKASVYNYRNRANNSSKLASKKPKRIKSKRRLLLKIFIILVIVAVASVLGYGWFLNHELKKINVSGLSASVGGDENILVAGSTTRCGLKFQNAQWGFCSQGVTGVNSDIIMIVHLVPKTHSVTLLSIPRDTFVPNARAGHEAFKIDAALYQGPSQLVNAIEEDFGIPIQHYVEVNFDGFVNIVNVLGGIKMNFPLPVYDAYSHLDVKVAGCTTLNGVTALQLIRARHLQYKPASITTNDTYYWPYELQSDIGRIARTHEFLKVLASSVEKKGLSNPITDEKLVSAILPNIIVDTGLNDSSILSLIDEFHSANFSNAPEYTLPISLTPFGSYIYQGANYGDVVFPVEPTDQIIIDKFLGETSLVNTMSGTALPAPNTISVSVMNGSGISSQASQIASGLQNLGYKIAGVGSDVPVSTQAQESVVYYANSRYQAQAEAVARSLNGYVIMAVNSSRITDGANITVVTGTGLSVVNSPSSSSSSTASTKAQTSTSTNVATNPPDGFSAPSSATAALTPWDPTACSN